MLDVIILQKYYLNILALVIMVGLVVVFIVTTTNCCRCIWSRVCAVQLFIKNVCPEGTKQEKLRVKKCMPLWTVSGQN